MDVKTLGTLPRLLPTPADLEKAAGAGHAEVAAGGKSFGQVLEDSLKQVNSAQHQADTAIQSLATGGNTSLHDTMLAVQQAELSFKLMMHVRNKLVEAYQEVLRMTV
jgi:flagellar hook-basal body complex protein FliE